MFRTLPLKDVRAVRAVHLAALATTELVDGRTEIITRLSRVPYHHLPVAVHIPDLRRPL